MAFFLASTPPTSPQPDYLPIIITSGIAIIAAILGAFVTYGLTQRQIRRGLVYRIVSDTPILSVQEEIEGKVKILFDKSAHQKSTEDTSQKPSFKQSFQNMSKVFNRGSNLREVKDLRFAIIEVQNAGRTPILPGEILEPVTFSFTGQTEVLDAGIVSVEPDDLKPVLEVALHSVTLKPLLLNKNDKVKLKILAAGIDDEIEVSARIAGVEKIINYQDIEKSRQRRNMWIGVPLLMIGFAMYILGAVELGTVIPNLLSRQMSPSTVDLYFFAMLFVGLILALIGAALSRRFLRYRLTHRLADSP